MDDNKKYKLWENLNGSGYYTKSFEDFNKQFSTPEQQAKLYDALYSNGYYTKSGEEFTQQFFAAAPVAEPEPVKKKRLALPNWKFLLRVGRIGKALTRFT